VHKSSIRLSSLAASNHEIVDMDTKHYLSAIMKTAIEKAAISERPSVPSFLQKLRPG